ncbi:ZP domain-containing protein-like isoform X1 [Ascaphus truei]|uniref:ZP domain-containing protein-like isoform X1 n=1 Tax=Ascaphus truei TaxID=8439 RepID=UPI003F592E1F
MPTWEAITEDTATAEDTTLYPTYEPNLYLSKIPLQFVVEVSAPVTSCAYGEYRPMFLSPTPRHGKTLLAKAGTTFQLHLSARAARDRIENVKVSGPSGTTKKFSFISASNTGNAVVEWTPTINDIGDHVPICFVAETSSGYQSELRCIIIIVSGLDKLANATLTCRENTMTLIIQKSSQNGLYENRLRLNDPKCLVTANKTHLIASVAFNSCGTQVEETQHDIVFKNQIISFENSTDVITRKHQVVIPFNCSFPKRNRVSATFHAQKAIYEFTEAGFGNFTYKFQFYKDDQFIEVETQYPVQVWLREILYMEIQVSSSVPSVRLFVESCRAAPRDDPNYPVFYDIIKDGCSSDETLVTYPGSRTKFRFGIEAFAFIGNFEEVYVSCTVILCKLGDASTRCSQGCTRSALVEPNPHRRKRSLMSETQQHFISQGPLRMKDRSAGNGASDPKPSLNMNPLTVTIAVVAIVALIAVILHNYVKKARVPQYEKLATRDF